MIGGVIAPRRVTGHLAILVVATLAAGEPVHVATPSIEAATALVARVRKLCTVGAMRVAHLPATGGVVLAILPRRV